MVSRGHKFGLGQEAIYTPSEDFSDRVPVKCRITRLVPREGTQYQYHVECEPDGQHRRVWESQLAPVQAARPQN